MCISSILVIKSDLKLSKHLGRHFFIYYCPTMGRFCIRALCIFERYFERYFPSFTKMRKPVNHTSWVAVVTPIDRPKSVRNRCLIELFCGVVCVVTLPF